MSEQEIYSKRVWKYGPLGLDEPRLEEMVIDVPEPHCAGPGCDEVGSWHDDSLSRTWLRVAKDVVGYHFCSLRCLANWLAGELAKEEVNVK